MSSSDERALGLILAAQCAELSVRPSVKSAPHSISAALTARISRARLAHLTRRSARFAHGSGAGAAACAASGALPASGVPSLRRSLPSSASMQHW